MELFECADHDARVITDALLAIRVGFRGVEVWEQDWQVHKRLKVGECSAMA